MKGVRRKTPFLIFSDRRYHPRKIHVAAFIERSIFPLTVPWWKPLYANAPDWGPAPAPFNE
jgi:hypothetical protein